MTYKLTSFFKDSFRYLIKTLFVITGFGYEQ